ncbi:L-threonine synthase [Novosphingobium aromaticivorans DSM 12444]|uniref:Threonine synthase n=1 Tax=Novosphingobium aromaticivorans (strain ATCC 700278 / DSM 12444 / CCUG 56034 / CIP 105152 / NBRC 16084 / F199) TaxID=279238 RepID=Q2G9V7_NOVAD|nr:threonine synthase [Novosphingobium aromaticivorans]ABD25366.1 L-threonine synthase [Novosphingobium aromaticivorans DSM 12444]SCX91269.1 L-threonine synthase [Novosphingobium aromaticivorans]
MKYVSTRGQAPSLDFQGVTLAGLASDGGLYVPESWPQFSHDEIAAMAGLPYARLAQKIMQPYVGDCLTPERLLELCEQAYGRFAHAAVTPLKQLDETQWVLELFHGPTLAFKDVALQLLGLLFEEFLARPREDGGDEHITIVGATSGDTGSAAIDAVAGRAKVDIFMLHPHGRVSDVQRRQMTTVIAPNVHNIAIDGSFDDAQAMVKRMFNDSAMTGRFGIAAVNSINWARLMAQVVYYFYAALQLGAPHRKVAFSVPTGNFGDVFAGYVAAKMGLPIERLIVATNVNDILHRALSAGDYSASTVTPTAAPSMDIQVSSNFERLLFDGCGRDASALAAQMKHFEVTKAMQLTNAQRESAAALFSSARADAGDMANAMRWAFEATGEVLDPHTAIGLHAARAAEGIPAGVPIVTLATAHPAKFVDAVERATGVRPGLPARVGDLFEREERCDRLPGNYEAVAAYVAERATPKHG